MKNKLYDVVAININTGTVRIMEAEKERGDANAIMKMAVMRRGLDEEFYSEVIHGQYKEGDQWEGKGDIEPYMPETSGEGRIQRIGNTSYPIGKRGL